jgi:hypothetical protein
MLESAQAIAASPTIPRAVKHSKKWDELSPRARRAIVAAGVVDGVLKVAALIDLARRPSQQVRGSKAVWAGAVSVTNSLGAVPVAYFVWGRRHPGGRHGW